MKKPRNSDKQVVGAGPVKSDVAKAGVDVTYEQKLWGSRRPHITETTGQMSRGTATRERKVTKAALVLEGVSVLNSSPTRNSIAGNGEPQEVERRSRISLYHFIQCSASPAISPAAITAGTPPA